MNHSAHLYQRTKPTSTNKTPPFLPNKKPHQPTNPAPSLPLAPAPLAMPMSSWSFSVTSLVRWMMICFKILAAEGLRSAGGSKQQLGGWLVYIAFVIVFLMGWRNCQLNWLVVVLVFCFRKYNSGCGDILVCFFLLGIVLWVHGDNDMRTSKLRHRDLSNSEVSFTQAAFCPRPLSTSRHQRGQVSTTTTCCFCFYCFYYFIFFSSY